MAKIALLIGISKYEAGLASLPKAENDVEAMQRVLLNPEMGDFAPGDVTVLKNPQRQDMEDAIYHLYANRHKDDLVLFYFSGHGVTDEGGDFYFSTRQTQKNQNRLIPTTAVAAANVHNWMNKSKSKRLVVILDCCFSGAFAKGLTAKDSGTIDLQQHLGGEGRAILTASTSTQYAFESDGLDLSIYTHYLVEGIEKGVADQDGDGLIAIDELHQYAKSKVQEASPAMTPELYPHKDGYRIFLAKSPKDDPKLKYRKEVERRINRRGKFTIPARRLLNSLRLQLQLEPDVAEAIEAEVQQPYREYQRKLEEYEATLIETMEVEPNLSERTLNDLIDYQQHLGLRDEDVAPIEARIISQRKSTASKEKLPESIPQVQDKRPAINSIQINTECFTERLSNHVVLDMVAIPGSQFLMGSQENFQQAFTIQPFFMGKFPVTQAQWAVVATFDRVNIDLDPDPSHFKGANRPVECVSWDDAIEFCARLSRKTGKTYRLPSEAEWEYACRAGRSSPFYFGNRTTTDLGNYDGTDWMYSGTMYPGNYGQGGQGEYGEQTTDVGTFPANPFGLYDMHGNIWEWCQDEWHDENNHDPLTDRGAWLSNHNHQYIDLRGSSLYYDPWRYRSAFRDRYARGNRYIFVGFRVVIMRVNS
ncbi:caspase, EACC1-associated type [Nodularia sp. UHCC 0506]|uniref:caspase, EACC1-associated type n=1 Tax=Nodularia sp. UHCC 0506 TaxID=3110243 RepID=UPI002B20C3E3|nr:SUMF1/EgtB/PvdO family nonheme iron enzyme [Nodularia sp. UHCC 0506]MEA5514061.1 SUMF1/EgtB/PvdO family nonheme iron enzyme [Nodularia sp. UHCC 0506]